VKLVSFEGGFGRLDGDAVVPLGGDLVTYLETRESIEGAPLSVGDVRLLAPVPRPNKIICIGLNYRDHAAETGQEIPDMPILFPKYANSVIGPGASIEVPAAAVRRVDYEAELAVVVGRTAREVGVDDAQDFIAGYCCANDVSARDLQRRGGSQWMWGKAIDGFLPLGPCLVTPDEVGDPQRLAIRSVLNGEVMQSSNTEQMIFGCAELVSFVSQTITLEVGDVIVTGTPPGVGVARDPAVFMSEGDEITVEIEGLGALTNRIVHRPRAKGALGRS
jgi:2-keto-4-pentenoate hydratase/2-oxohepta-3-ene-1,7-dioic acid hydratase in catechol pathway